MARNGKVSGSTPTERAMRRYIVAKPILLEASCRDVHCVKDEVLSRLEEGSFLKDRYVFGGMSVERMYSLIQWDAKPLGGLYLPLWTKEHITSKNLHPSDLAEIFRPIPKGFMVFEERRLDKEGSAYVLPENYRPSIVAAYLVKYRGG